MDYQCWTGHWRQPTELVLKKILSLLEEHFPPPPVLASLAFFSFYEFFSVYHTKASGPGRQAIIIIKTIENDRKGQNGRGFINVGDDDDDVSSSGSVWMVVVKEYGYFRGKK